MQRTVFLIGFMGSGKTTFGKKLAAKLGLAFNDLDEVISANNGIPRVQTLIEEKGFNFFREVESSTLKSMDLAGQLVSTGGGTPCYFDNMAWMKNNGVVVYIELDEKSLFNRLKQTELNERPLLKGLDDEGLHKFIREKLQERRPFYEQAHIIFNPLKQKIEELQEEILAK